LLAETPPEVASMDSEQDAELIVVTLTHRRD
jgi:hypothetical protein